ncbi:MAG: hypothetical protein ACXVAX_01995 [Pseudobdellovibrio sp.]
MSKLLFLVLVLGFAGCADQQVATQTQASSPLRVTSSTSDIAGSVCMSMIPEAIAKATPYLTNTDLLSVKDKRKLTEVTPYQLNCTGKIENSVGYKLDRAHKIVNVESDFQSLNYLVDSPYAQAKIREYGLNIQYLNLHRILVAFGAVILADQADILNNNYELFYKTLKKLEQN